jgi:3-oxoacyl-[acyl-carrier-protein] synthase II
LLGLKGLLGKDAATRLALCAIHRALKLPAGAARRNVAPDPRTAVVVSSNFGNCANVVKIAKTAREGGVRDVSALDIPNASSNIIASTVAIWFRFGGPNLTVCSGASSGLDAIALASLLLRADRADRVVVVGVEPGDEIAQLLQAGRASPDASSTRLRSVAACVVLEALDNPGPGMPVLEAIGEGKDFPAGLTSPSVMIGPACCRGAFSPSIDLVAELGDPYGALGVMQVAIAATHIASGPLSSSGWAGVVCGDALDGWRMAVIAAAPVPRPETVQLEEPERRAHSSR